MLEEMLRFWTRSVPCTAGLAFTWRGMSLMVIFMLDMKLLNACSNAFHIFRHLLELSHFRKQSKKSLAMKENRLNQ